MTIHIRYIFLMLLPVVFSTAVIAQEPVKVEFNLEPAAKSIYEQVLNKDELEGIFGLLKKYKPSENNLFQWDPKTPHRPTIGSVTFTLTTREDPIIKQHVSESNFPGEELIEKSAVTILWSKRDLKTKKADESQQNIEVFIFLDRIFFDNSGNKRLDGVTRMIGILGHEIFGNVTRFLNVEKDKDIKSNLHRIHGEIHAFQAGIDFLSRAIEDLKKNSQNKRFVDGLIINLEEQIKMQDQWYEILKIESSILENHNRFTIQQGSDVETMNVYKISGEEVNLEKIYNMEARVLDLNLLPVGTYLVHIKATNPEQEIIRRVVILTPGKGIKGLSVKGSYANFWVTLNGMDTEIPRINRMLDKAKAEIKAVFSENECLVKNLSAEVYGYQSNDAYKYHIFINWDATCNKIDKMEVSIKMPSWKWNSAYVRIQPYLKGQPKTFIEKEIE